jgi:hypothetical protein
VFIDRWGKIWIYIYIYIYINIIYIYLYIYILYIYIYYMIYIYEYSNVHYNIPFMCHSSNIPWYPVMNSVRSLFRPAEALLSRHGYPEFRPRRCWVDATWWNTAARTKMFKRASADYAL